MFRLMTEIAEKRDISKIEGFTTLAKWRPMMSALSVP